MDSLNWFFICVVDVNCQQFKIKDKLKNIK